MAAPIIQAKYDQLDEIARRFSAQAESIREMYQNLRRHVDALQNKGWIGEGADSFFMEMEDDVFPALKRLTDAYEESRVVTQRINEIIQAAEQDAANQFNVGDGAIVGGGSSGSGGTTPVIAPAPGAGFGGARPKSSWTDKLEWKVKGDIWEFDKKTGEGGFNPGIGIHYGIDEAAFIGDPSKDGIAALGGEAGFGLGVSQKGLVIGPHGEFYVVRGNVDGVLGSDSLALTGGVTGNVLMADGFAGYKDGSIGASIGGTLASVEGEAGVNVAGVNVGLKGEVGLKAELGFKIGAETEVKLPFISFGFAIGGAKRNEVQIRD